MTIRQIVFDRVPQAFQLTSYDGKTAWSETQRRDVTRDRCHRDEKTELFSCRPCVS